MTVTRRYHFSASHRLHSPRLTAAENAALYGKCNNPFGHGHNYILEVTVTGNPDPQSGLLLPISELDRLVDETVLRSFAHSNLNVDVPQFTDCVPTTENVALVITDVLRRNWSAYLGDFAVRLHRIHIQETDRNGFEISLEPRTSAPHTRAESLISNA